MNHGSHQVTRENLATYDTAWSVAEYTRDVGLQPIETALINDFFPAGSAKVLDLGCGGARTTIALARLGYQTTGIDLSPALLARARQRYPQLDLRLVDATKLTFPDESFDAALFSYNGIDCIYPVAERIRCMSEVFRVLRPGGIFLVSSHNLIGALFSGGYYYLRGHWNAMKLLVHQGRNRLAREWFIRYADASGVQHLYSAPPERTIQQLEGCGFRVLHTRGFTGERRRRSIRMHEKHVYFVAAKPI